LAFRSIRRRPTNLTSPPRQDSRATNHGTFFISTQTWNRYRLFQKPANAELFLETLQHYRHKGRYNLHAFVIMPDHIHLLLTSQGITLERAVQLIEGGFSRRLCLLRVGY
jgi:putative transposase